MREWEWNLLEDKASLEQVEIAGVVVKRGDRVRLCPRNGGDILDIALRDQVATVESIEEDYEGSQHVCVVLDNDPGRDLGMMRQPGHRFFFKTGELEPIAQMRDTAQEQSSKTAPVKPQILVAGVGNIFLGDDGFGVEVARRLAEFNLPPVNSCGGLWRSRPGPCLCVSGWLRDNNSHRRLSAWQIARDFIPGQAGFERI